MAVKRGVFITAELDWAEEQLRSWRAYVDKNPFEELQDRTEERSGPRGTSIVIIATIEQQGKFLQETMKNYLSLLEVVNNLREREQIKIEARGKADVSLQAESFLKSRG